jgi:GNAT superfamily N-acetyltransferase
MPAYRVVPYTPDRLPEVEVLWREHPGDAEAVERRRRHFRWLAERNPFLDGDCAYYLLVDGDRVIGMHGHMPQRLSVKGRQRRFYLAHDDLLAAECRGKGLGKVMLGGVMEQSAAFAGALWHNAPNLKLYSKCGWTDCSALVFAIRIVDPRRNLEKRFGRNPLARVLAALLRPVLALRSALSRARPSGAYRVADIDRFDERFDALFERAAASLPIAVVRNAAYLNWKFVAKPDNRYRRFAAFDAAQELRAYAVVSAGVPGPKPVAKILDMLCDPAHPQALDAVLRHAIGWLESQPVISITCVGSPAALACLERFGFRQRPSDTGFMYVHWEADFERDFVADIGNWYITSADADGDAWTPT